RSTDRWGRSRTCSRTSSRSCLAAFAKPHRIPNMSLQAEPTRPTVTDVIAVADWRAGLRRFLRQSERIARQCGLTPQRYLLLLMIKGSHDGREQSTVTELSERLQLAQSTVTELVRRAEEAGLIVREQSQQDAR